MKVEYTKEIDRYSEKVLKNLRASNSPKVMS